VLRAAAARCFSATPWIAVRNPQPGITLKASNIRSNQRIGTMNEHEQRRKFADKSAAIANETLAKDKAAAEQSAHAVERSYSTTVENMRGYNLKMIDMAQANSEGAFQFARQLATAKSPSDLVELWTSHARKQYEMLSEQLGELTALGQKMVSESAGPIARSVGQVFNKAS
jgi:phasin